MSRCRAALFALAASSQALPLGDGCTLYLRDPIVPLFTTSNASGFASVQLVVPADLALRGALDPLADSSTCPSARDSDSTSAIESAAAATVRAVGHDRELLAMVSDFLVRAGVDLALAAR